MPEVISLSTEPYWLDAPPGEGGRIAVAGGIAGLRPEVRGAALLIVRLAGGSEAGITTDDLQGSGLSLSPRFGPFAYIQADGTDAGTFRTLFTIPPGMTLRRMSVRLWNSDGPLDLIGLRVTRTAGDVPGRTDGDATTAAPEPAAVAQEPAPVRPAPAPVTDAPVAASPRQDAAPAAPLAEVSAGAPDNGGDRLAATDSAFPNSLAFARSYIELLQIAGQNTVATDLDILARIIAAHELPPRSLHLAAEIFFREGQLRRAAEATRRWLARTDEAPPRWVSRYLSYERLLLEGVRIPRRRATATIDRTPGKVLSVVNWVPPYTTNGYAIRTHKIARAFEAVGAIKWITHSRVGFPWDQRTSVRKPTAEVTTYDDIRYYHRQNEFPSQTDVLAYIEHAALALQQIATRLRPAAIHAASNYLNALPALICARRLGLPFIYEVRGFWEISASVENPNWSGTDRYRLDAAMEALVAGAADRVLTLTAGMQNELVARGVRPDKIRLFPNCCDPSEVREAPRDAALARLLGLQEGAVTLGYIGSVVKYEGLTDLVEACAALRNEGLRFNLVIVGDGKDLANVVSAVEANNLHDHVRLVGRVPHQDVDRYYALMDAIVLPRRPYPVCEIVSPLKPLEALLLRKLVVVSDVGGMSDMIRHGEKGVIFRKGDLASLTECLRKVVGDFGSFATIREQGRRWVLSERLWTAAIARIQTDLADLTALHPASPAPGRPGLAVSPGQRIDVDYRPASIDAEGRGRHASVAVTWGLPDGGGVLGTETVTCNRDGVPPTTLVVPMGAGTVSLSPEADPASRWTLFKVTAAGLFRAPEERFVLSLRNSVGLRNGPVEIPFPCRGLTAICLVGSVLAPVAPGESDALYAVTVFAADGRELKPLVASHGCSTLLIDWAESDLQHLRGKVRPLESGRIPESANL